MDENAEVEEAGSLVEPRVGFSEDSIVGETESLAVENRVGFAEDSFIGETESLAVENRVGFAEDSFIGGSESLAGGGSVVSALWSAASVYDNHPLKLILADSQQKDIYYLPPKRKDQAKMMQRKIDAQKAKKKSGSGGNARSTVKVSAARRADSLVPKHILKGKDADVEKKLLDPFKGLQGEKARKALYAKLEEKKEFNRRKKILAKDPHAFDPPPDPAAIHQQQEENYGNEEGAGAGEEEEVFNLAVYEADLWADSGTAFVRNQEVKALRKTLRVRRWIALVCTVNAGTAFCEALRQARLKRIAVAHLWGSDKVMHAVGAIQKAFFRFRHFKYQGATETAARLAARKDAMMEGALRHGAGHDGEDVYEERKAIHAQRSDGATLITLFLRDVHKCLSFKVNVRLFVNKIKGLQSRLRQHLAANKARLEALRALFEGALPALINHIHVIDKGNGLDSPRLNRAEHAAVMRSVNAGLSRRTKGLRVVREMRSDSSFHSFLRLSTTHRDRLHHVSFQAKMAQGRVFTDAGGGLIEGQVRDRVLRMFLYRRRRVYVSELTRRLLHRGLENDQEESRARAAYTRACYSRCHPATRTEGVTFAVREDHDNDIDALDAGEGEEDEGRALSGGAVDHRLVKQFLLSSPSSEDVVAIALQNRLTVVDAAKDNYYQQKKRRQNNLTSQTVWSDLLSMITPNDLVLLFFEMERISTREREEREEAERELARERRKSQRAAARTKKKRSSVSLRMAAGEESPLDGSSADTGSGILSRGSSTSSLSTQPSRSQSPAPQQLPEPPAAPKPSSLFTRGDINL